MPDARLGSGDHLAASSACEGESFKLQRRDRVTRATASNSGPYPTEKGYVPKIAVYDDRHATNYVLYAQAIVQAAEAQGVSGGYAVIMLPDGGRRSGHEDELAAMVMAKLGARDLVCSVIHAASGASFYELNRRDNRYEPRQDQTGRLRGYVIMGNHYHLALETPAGNLVAGMQWLQATFANRFNKLRKESGHVFQGRYKALQVEPGGALGELGRRKVGAGRGRCFTFDIAENGKPATAKVKHRPLSLHPKRRRAKRASLEDRNLLQ